MKTIFTIFVFLCTQNIFAAASDCSSLKGEYLFSDKVLPSEEDLNGPDSVFVPDIVIDNSGASGKIRVISNGVVLFEATGEPYQFSQRKNVFYKVSCQDGKLVGTTTHYKTESVDPHAVTLIITVEAYLDDSGNLVVTSQSHIPQQDGSVLSGEIKSKQMRKIVRTAKVTQQSSGKCGSYKGAINLVQSSVGIICTASTGGLFQRVQDAKG